MFWILGLELFVVKLVDVLVVVLQVCITLTAQVHFQTLNQTLHIYFRLFFFLYFLFFLSVCFGFCILGFWGFFLLLLFNHGLIHQNVRTECIHGLASTCT